jgi:ribosome-associated protein
MKSVCDEAGELGDTRDYRPLSQCGTDGDQWMLIDFVDVVLHVFNQESRMFYDLDGLWGDAKRVEWKDETALAATAK